MKCYLSFTWTLSIQFSSYFVINNVMLFDLVLNFATQTMSQILERIVFRGRSRDFEKRGRGRGALYVGHHGQPTKKTLGFRWSKKAKRTLETKVFGETFLSVFSNFLHFNESLPMKSYQFFKIYIRFYKKREKTLIQQSIKKEKLRKFGLCFI